MNIASSLAIIALAALIHASFQLSVSLLTLLSSHTIGKQKSHTRLLLLTSSFSFGAGVMTILLLCFSALFLHTLARTADSFLLWTVCCGLLTGVGFSIWLFYYRKEAGTSLWIPRNFATFLRKRTKATSHSAEAFSLGMTSTIAELLFIIAPLTAAGFIVAQLDARWQIIGILLYGLVASSSLLLVSFLVGGGFSLSRIQKWRETNKHFLQFSAGTGLLVLGFYLYVDQVTTVAVNAAAAAAGGGF